MSEIQHTTTLISEYRAPEINKLFEYIKEDRKKARVFYMELKKHNLEEHRKVLMEYDNGDFKILCYKRTYGVNKNNMIYNSKKLIGAIYYTKKRLHFKFGGKIVPLTLAHITELDARVGYPSHNKENQTFINIDFGILNYFDSKFPWFEIYFEKYDFYHSFPLNRILTYKLTNESKLLKKYFGLPMKTIQTLIESNKRGYSKVGGDACKFKVLHETWKVMKQNLIHPEKLTVEFLKNRFFDDTCKLAYKLGEKVNCGWSEKRLKVEHDRMAKEHALYLFEFMPLRNLKIGEIYQHFEKYSGYYCFRTNKELVAEGNRLSHCVGGYESQVSSGSCAIFSAHDCTLQLSKDWGSSTRLTVSQYYGWDNTNPPAEHIAKVNDWVNKFNLFYPRFISERKDSGITFDEFLLTADSDVKADLIHLKAQKQKRDIEYDDDEFERIFDDDWNEPVRRPY